MAEFTYTVDDLMKTRFIISPLAITSLSAKVVYNPQHYSLYGRWIQYAREALDDLDLPVLADFHQGAPSCMPDLLSPFPVHTEPSFEDELQQIATLTEDLVEESIDFQLTVDPPEADLQKYVKHPRLLRERVVDEMQRYWQRVVRPHWSHVHATLESDIMQRSRQLAAHGYEKTIMELDSRMTVVSGRLNINASKLQVTLDLAGAGILLRPNIFADRSRISISSAYPNRIALTYPALGSGNWRENRTTEPSDALRLMFGEHRSRLLFRLQRPMTTLELAETLHLTSSAVSQQLKQLYQAGLVSKHRLGKRVYYRLNERGEELLYIFESTPGL